jgi:DNA repair protein RadC
MSTLLQISEIEVRYVAPQFINKVKIDSSKAVLAAMKEVWDIHTIGYQESFIAFFMNRANHLLGYRWLSKGGTTGTIVDAKHLFGIAVKANACGIILGHNHPSGSLRPSRADIELTKKLVEGGKLLDINILDHLIITPSFTYYSFADDGLM